MWFRSKNDRQVWESFRKHSRTFSFAARLLPASVRTHVAHVYLLCRRIDTIADELVLDVGVDNARTELDALQSALDRCVAGRPDDDWIWPRLHDTHQSYPLRIEPIRQLIDGARWDLDGRPILTRNDLYEYSGLVGGTVGEIMLPFLVARPEDADDLAEIARTLGVAMQITNILRDVGEDWTQRQRVYLPQTSLSDAGLDISVLVSCAQQAWLPNDAYVTLLEELMEEADSRYRESQPAVAALHPLSQPAIKVAIRMYREIMNVVRANRYDNLSRRAYVPLRRKLALLAIDDYERRRKRLQASALVTN